MLSGSVFPENNVRADLHQHSINKNVLESQFLDRAMLLELVQVKLSSVTDDGDEPAAVLEMFPLELHHLVKAKSLNFREPLPARVDGQFQPLPGTDRADDIAEPDFARAIAADDRVAGFVETLRGSRHVVEQFKERLQRFGRIIGLARDGAAPHV